MTTHSTEIRKLVLATLARHGGRIESSSGLATRLLMDDLGYTGKITSMNGVLKRMVDEGMIERRIKGKRCKVIALPGRLDQGDPVPAAPEPVPEPASPPSDITDDTASSVAVELLRLVVDKLGEPDSAELKVRLAAALNEAERQRRQRIDIGTQLEGAIRERDSLRVAVRRLEANVAALSREASRVPDDHTRRELARMMAEMPANGK